MQYQISSDNIQISESMKTLTMDKFARIEARLKDFPEDTLSVRVVLNTAPNDQFEVRAAVRVAKFDYHTDDLDYSLETAIIDVVDELLRMMEKDKEKWERWEEDIRDTKRFEEEEAEILEEL
jgi:ribosomal subunit interface protein